MGVSSSAILRKSRFQMFLDLSTFVSFGYFFPNILSKIAVKWCFKFSEAATRGVLCQKVFLEISQNSQENTCARVTFERLAQVFPVNFVEFVRTPFL